MSLQTKIFDGKALAQKILTRLAETITTKKLHPQLLIIQAGNNPASTQYVGMKKKRAEEIGVTVIHEILSENTDLEQQVVQTIEQYKHSVHGIMIQLPVVSEVPLEQILTNIPRELDVDGLLLTNSPFHTAVADAVCEILTEHTQDSKSENVLVIGNAPYAGGSIITALRSLGYTNVNGINEFTKNNKSLIAHASIVISCVGKPQVFSEKDLKKGAILIDVGTSVNSEGKIVGDFLVALGSNHLGGFTPVPGGVGPVTVAVLLKHLVNNTITLKES
ncbi:bifunctional 5,10-methylenetetrahydrofolate dehydrogenase/5,10-methenyltetrahydrofolate cyclohydrolase [bacterium]|nr:bifunctional 5,10-methylenetetrahydrofolate dehydrogenase/5,10-methenyltetrahydrofolate cyclohydrolase [bacterium]